MEFRVENFNLIITFDVGSLYLTGTLGCNFYNLGTCFMELCNKDFILPKTVYCSLGKLQGGHIRPLPLAEKEVGGCDGLAA